MDGISQGARGLGTPCYVMDLNRDATITQGCHFSSFRWFNRACVLTFILLVWRCFWLVSVIRPTNRVTPPIVDSTRLDKCQYASQLAPWSGTPINASENTFQPQQHAPFSHTRFPGKHSA